MLCRYPPVVMVVLVMVVLVPVVLVVADCAAGLLVAVGDGSSPSLYSTPSSACFAASHSCQVLDCFCAREECS